MARALQMAQSARILMLAAAEQAMLLDEGGDVPDGVADRNDDAGIGKQPQKIFQAAEIVVGLREIARTPAQPQQLADMVAEEALECGIAGIPVEKILSPRVMQRRKERPPENRSEERRAGQGCVSTCRSRMSP